MSCLNVRDILEKIFSDALQELFSIEDVPEVVLATSEEFGHYQCNEALKLAKLLHKNPREIAQALVSCLETVKHPIWKNLSIAGPGFINIELSPTYIAKDLSVMYQDDFLGVPRPVDKQRILVDFSSPNIAKQMHVGHLRSTIIGDAIARLFTFLGHDVIRVNHVGDFGTQFGMLITYILDNKPHFLENIEELTIAELSEWYTEAKKSFEASEDFTKRSREAVIKLQSNDRASKEIWQRLCEISMKDFSKIYDTLGISIETRGESFYENFLPDVINDLKDKHFTSYDAGALCVFVEGFQNKSGDPLPLILQKQDGGYNYATTDLAAFKYRIEKDHADRIIIVTDFGQKQHFSMVYAVAQRMGYIDARNTRFDHVPFGVVLSPSGKRFRTREGKTEKLIDLLNEAVLRAKKLLLERDWKEDDPDLEKTAHVLGIGSIKYADLSSNRIKDYVFSYDKMLQFEGNTAAFILYAYVRIQSIQTKGSFTPQKDYSIQLEHPSEIALGIHLRRFAEVLFSMADELYPNRLTEYLFALAEKFHAFFRDCPVIQSEQEANRMHICELTKRVLRTALFLLGIDTLDRM